MSYDMTHKLVDKFRENHDILVKQWFQTNPDGVKFLGDNIDMRVKVNIMFTFLNLVIDVCFVIEINYAI